MGLLSSIFGGRSVSKSGNKFADDIKTAYSPGMDGFGKGFGTAANILGLGGGAAQDEALDNWWNSSGGQFQLTEGLGDVNDKFHSLGLGRSGAAMKAMEQYRSDLASTKLNEYLGNIFNLNQQSLGAGSLIANAGQFSKGHGEGQGGLGKAIGVGLSLFSDRRLKAEIVRIGEAANGLPWYSFRYLWDKPGTVRQGLMSDDVRAHRPEAIVPDPSGFDRVNYGLALA